MSEAEEYFHLVGKSIKGSNPAKTFGHQSYAIGKKPFCFLHDDDVAVFKLTGKLNQEAIKIKGAKYFDPMGTGKGMGNWVVLDFKNKAHWEFYAREAFKILTKELEQPPKKK